MVQNKNHIDCQNFSTVLCPRRDNELMVQFLRDTECGKGYTRTIDTSKSDEIDMKFCASCDSFKTNRIK